MNSRRGAGHQEFRDRLYNRAALAASLELVVDSANQRAAHDGTVGETTHFAHLISRANPEADAHGQPAHLPESGHLVRQPGGNRVSLARSTGHRNLVNESRRAFGDLLATIHRRGGRDKPDVAQLGTTGGE